LFEVGIKEEKSRNERKKKNGPSQINGNTENGKKAV
jgi:hypothetical protein